jgi:hypothetical protein
MIDVFCSIGSRRVVDARVEKIRAFNTHTDGADWGAEEMRDTGM